MGHWEVLYFSGFQGVTDTYRKTGEEIPTMKTVKDWLQDIVYQNGNKPLYNVLAERLSSAGTYLVHRNIWADTDRNRITIVEEHNPQRDIFQNIFGRYLSFYLREAMSHAQTSRMETDGSSLTISRNTDRMHTANAATVREHEVLMNRRHGSLKRRPLLLLNQQQISGRSSKWAKLYV